MFGNSLKILFICTLNFILMNMLRAFITHAYFIIAQERSSAKTLD